MAAFTLKTFEILTDILNSLVFLKVDFCAQDRINDMGMGKTALMNGLRFEKKTNQVKTSIKIIGY